MSDLLVSVLVAVGHGLLTELPAQLVTGIAASIATAWYTRRRSAETGRGAQNEPTTLDKA